MQPSFLPIRSLAANTVFYRSLRTDPFLKDIFHRDYSTGGSQPLRSLTGIVYIPIPSYGFVSIGRFLRIRSHIWIVSTDFLVPISLLGSCLPILLQQSFSTDPISHLDRLYRFLYTDFFARIVSTDLLLQRSFSTDPIRSPIWIVSTDSFVPISLRGSCLPILLRHSRFLSTRSIMIASTDSFVRSLSRTCLTQRKRETKAERFCG